MTLCRKLILETILSRPVTFMNLVSAVNCSPETVNKYVDQLENQKKITFKKGKFKIFYNPKLELEKIDFYELMLNNSIKLVVSILLTSKDLSQTEIEQKISKSRPTISRTLSILVQNNVVQIDYHSPFKTYSIKNKPKILSWIDQTNSNLIHVMSSNTSQMLG